MTRRKCKAHIPVVALVVKNWGKKNETYWRSLRCVICAKPLKAKKRLKP